MVKDEANDPPRRAKMIAEKPLPRGTSDVQGLSAANMYEMNEPGVLEQLDYSKIPNAPNLIPTMKYPYGVGHIYSGMVVLYNPKLIKTPPRASRTRSIPSMGNKLGIIDIQYQYTMMAAAMASGGTPSNFEPGKERLIACKKAGARIYPTNEAFAQALKTEEIGIGIMWKARAVQWQNAGIPSRRWRRRKACLLYVSGFAMPEERAEQGGRLRLSRRYAGSLARRRTSRSTWATTRPSPTPRSRPICTSASASPKKSRSAWSISTRLHGEERRRVEGVVGQGVQGLSVQ